MKKFIKIILFVMIIFQGYALFAVKQGCVRRPDLGAWIKILPGGQVEVTKVTKKSAAAKKGIRKGDIIKAWDGSPVKIKKIIEYFNLLYEKEPKDRVRLTIRRGNKEIKKKVKLGFVDILKEIDVIIKVLADEKRVNLVILNGKVTNVLIKDPAILAEWKETVRNQLLVEYEEIYLNWLGMWGNFSVVDRHRVEKVLEELKFGYSGLVSREARNKLGEILGATHIVVVGYSRTPGKWNFKDKKTIRMIEIETGKVLASYILDLKPKVSF